MNAYTDKRACARIGCSATIEFSYFNKKHCYEAQTLNCSDGGICFKSEVSLPPPTIVVIRVKNFHPHGDCRGLRSVTLAEPKWCKEILSETEQFYEIGVKYRQPEY
jgi:hypothetical protein